MSIHIVIEPRDIQCMSQINTYSIVNIFSIPKFYIFKSILFYHNTDNSDLSHMVLSYTVTVI